MAGKTTHQNRLAIARDLSWVDMPLLLSNPQFQEFQRLLPEFEFENWQDPEVRERNIDLMRRRSSIYEQVIADKGGWILLEKIYLGDLRHITQAEEHDPELDKLLCSLPLCFCLGTRYEYVTKYLFPRYIRKLLEERGRVRIASYGSGTGRDVMEVMTQFGPEVEADFYDTDPRALVLGERISEERGLAGRTRHHERDLRYANGNRHDLGIMVGVICPLPDAFAIRWMRAVRKESLNEKGILITSATSDKATDGDPLSRFLIEYLADWYLEHRDEERLREIAERAGYLPIETSAERLGYFNFVVGRKARD